MNIIKIKLFGLTAITILSTDCATTPVERAKQVQQLSYAAASIGTSIALKENATLKPHFDIAYSTLDSLVNSKKITGLLLREILSKLPIKELKSDTARIAIEGATYLYDVSVGDKVNIENNIYVLAAATGIRDGLKIALGY